MQSWMDECFGKHPKSPFGFLFFFTVPVVIHASLAVLRVIRASLAQSWMPQRSDGCGKVLQRAAALGRNAFIWLKRGCLKGVLERCVALYLWCVIAGGAGG